MAINRAPRASNDLRVVPTVAGMAGTGLVLGGVGATVASLVKTHALGWSGIARAAGKSAAIGAGAAGALLLIDRISGGAVGSMWHDLRQVLGDTHQLGVVFHHLDKPWLGFDAKSTHDTAVDWQHRLWGPREHTDDGADAFRHTMGSALFYQRLLQHGVGAEEAASIDAEAGRAHEADGDDNGSALASEMDIHNNAVGVSIVGDGHAADGSWLTQRQLVDRALAALRDGRTVVIDDAGTGIVPTGPADLPPSMGGAAQ